MRQEVGVSRNVHSSGCPKRDEEKLIIQPSLFCSDLLRFLLSKSPNTTAIPDIVFCHRSLTVTLMKRINILYSEETRGLRGEECTGSDRRRAVADLGAELVRHLGQRRLLLHVVLHDDFLVCIDWSVCVVRVVPWLISARLIGWLGRHGLFAFAAEQLATSSNQRQYELGK